MKEEIKSVLKKTDSKLNFVDIDNNKFCVSLDLCDKNVITLSFINSKDIDSFKVELSDKLERFSKDEYVRHNLKKVDSSCYSYETIKTLYAQADYVFYKIKELYLSTLSLTANNPNFSLGC